MSMLERYIVFKGKPFSLVTAVKATGLPREEAIRELSAMEAKGRLRMVKGGYVPLRELPICKKIRYDFRFKEYQIEIVLTLMDGWTGTDRIIRFTGWSHPKVARLMRTLHYMGLVSKKSGKRNSNVYLKRGEYRGERIPWFWGEVAGKR